MTPQSRRSNRPQILEPEININDAVELSNELAVSPLFARILVERGFKDAASVKAFLETDMERDWLDPFLLPDMERAARRIKQAIESHERICIFGDYDLDGISATAVMVRGLKALGNEPLWVLPKRLEDGYGLSDSTIERIASKKPNLLITVDSGISARGEVAELMSLGMDVVITDHHEPGEAVPENVPVVNPKLDESYEQNEAPLAGAGVALKVIQAVERLLGGDAQWRKLIQLATLGTVADVMPLIGENRALVKAGIQQMQTTPFVGIAELAALTNTPLSKLSSERISFSLAPRLNASGRMGSAGDSLRLLITDEPEKALHYSYVLDDHNRNRQRIEAEMVESVLAILERSYKGESAIVLADEGWHDGVKGIVASRIAQSYGVPTIICSLEDGMAIGSGRSVGEIDLYQALQKSSTHLVRFGGHAGAVGCAIKIEKLEAFRSELIHYLDSLPHEMSTPRRTVSAVATLDEINLDLSHEIDSLEPFGEKNPRPVLLARNIEVKNANSVGRNNEHLKFSASQFNANIAAIYFRAPAIDSFLERTQNADALFRLETDVWQGRERLQMHITSLECVGNDCPWSSEQEDYSAFLDELFNTAEESFERRDYSNIADAEFFHTKLAGVTFEGRQELIAKLRDDDELELVREPDNSFDSNALGVFSSRLGERLGYLNRDLARVLSAEIDGGEIYEVALASISGRDDAGKALGLNVKISRSSSMALAEEREAYQKDRRKLYRSLGHAELEQKLKEHFIGSSSLHQAQSDTLESLSQGVNTLTVMATGRGKSLIFHLHAAKIALLNNEASIFVFPLRALVADQAFHLQNAFADIGLRAEVITGESSEKKRIEAFEAYAQAEIDIVLTTPEFLHFHADKFAAANRCAFCVVDEAHHVGQARAGSRPAYAMLGESFARLNADGTKPVVLAVTATASDEVANRITETLYINNRILDASIRDNLVIVDKRDIENPERYLIDLASRKEKMVVYVNSRQESVKLARLLRTHVPTLAWKVAFYNAGLSKAARQEIERRFRDSDILITISTSAFGEGVNIPDIRHVVLYHHPFNDVEFNQMSGRGGRDGARAHIHLCFNERDSERNLYILETQAPALEVLAGIYEELKSIAEREGEEFAISNAELAERVGLRKRSLKSKLSESAVSTAIGIFRELGFVSTSGRSSARRISVNMHPERRAISDSVRYSEGLAEIDSFEEFKSWISASDADTLLRRINRPILPNKK